MKDWRAKFAALVSQNRDIKYDRHPQASRSWKLQNRLLHVAIAIWYLKATAGSIPWCLIEAHAGPPAHQREC